MALREGVTVTLFKIIVPYIKIIQRIIIFFLKNEGNFYYVTFFKKKSRDINVMLGVFMTQFDHVSSNIRAFFLSDEYNSGLSLFKN